MESAEEERAFYAGLFPLRAFGGEGVEDGVGGDGDDGTDGRFVALQDCEV